MDAKELKEILDKHLKWLRVEKGGSRADLYGANLYGADLYGADLYGADLSRANLSRADLSRADLSRADLSRANLSRADLYGADLYGADLYGANLSGANLSGANLSRADLYGADLSGADLSGADLSGANLSGANLSRADLYGANLYGADLSGADLYGADIELELVNKFFPICCPEYGSFIAWKKARNGYIVKLEVLETAKRSSAYGRKCRCSEAKVLSIENFDGSAADVQEVYSQHDRNFVYRVGETVKVEDFDEDRRNECAHGIHFFITRQEAVDY